MSVIIINRDGKRINSSAVLSYAPMCIPTLNGQPNAVCITVRGQADKEWTQDLDPARMNEAMSYMDQAVAGHEYFVFDMTQFMIKKQ